MRNLLLAAIFLPTFAAADGVRLRSGAEVRGKVVSGVGTDAVTVRTLTGVTVTVAGDAVTGVSKRTANKEEYITRSREVADTVSAREGLVEWCVTNRHPKGRLEQFAEIVRLDSQHEAANKALGNVFRDGLWMTREQANREDGLIPFGDRWVSPEEAALLAEQEELDEARLAWFPKVDALERRLRSSDSETAVAALEELRRIDDPTAGPALVKKLGDDPHTPLRLEVVEALGRMSHYSVLRKLVRFAAYDADATVRQRAIDAIPIEFQLTAADQFVKLLNDQDNTVVRRAAEALQAVGSKDAIPHLVRALRTTHRRRVRVPRSGPRFTVSDGQIGLAQGPQATLPPEVLNGLRAGAYPFGVDVLPTSANTTVKTVKVSIPNEEVLLALVTITKQNFGYDEAAWNRWWRTEGRFVAG